MVDILVGSTFSSAVGDKGKDVLVLFFAPWCGHSRRFTPIYEKLATKFRHVPSLRLYKIDATRNEFLETEVSGYPTITLFRAGETPKQQVEFSGHRSLEGIVEWLHKHCAKPFDDTPPPQEVQKTPSQAGSGLLDSLEDLDL